ncbi:LPS assembly lipoprotein LptE [Marinobacter daepoensis]|uniref:LPS-assembly lipoprotein LptE n=1 Tax=Marinobacter daepoensis TaxID=262077 RepID=UPI0004245EAB|nr:LPS assembly lipoprotein LptE [Marinobacter daepoensis]
MLNSVPALIKPGLLALLAALAGCGFQLRGSSPVPAAVQPLAVECSRSMPGEFCQSLREQLELGGVELKGAREADYILRLSGYRQDRRASAITAQAAAAEYILRHTVTMELVTAQQIPLLAPTDLNTSETYRYDETNVLAKQREEEELRRQLGDRLAQQVIFRLAPMTEQRIQALIDEHSNTEKDPETP